MKVLIVYYSRSGKTRNIAEVIAKKLGAELEGIVDHKNRKGLLGFITSGNEAHLKRVIPIERLKNEPKQYDLIIIGTPIWAGSLSSPVRSFLMEYKEVLPKLAFFTTCLGSDQQNVLLEMEEMIHQKPVAVMSITYRDAKKQFVSELVNTFIQNIEQNLKKE